MTTSSDANRDQAELETEPLQFRSWFADRLATTKTCATCGPMTFIESSYCPMFTLTTASRGLQRPQLLHYCSLPRRPRRPAARLLTARTASMVALASALRLLTLLGFLSPPAWAAANCTFVQDVDYAGGLAGSSCNPVVHTPGGQQECCDACDACPECVRGRQRLRT